MKKKLLICCINLCLSASLNAFVCGDDEDDEDEDEERPSVAQTVSKDISETVEEVSKKVSKFYKDSKKDFKKYKRDIKKNHFDWFKLDKVKPNDKPNQDTITLSSGYFSGQYSNRELAVFGMELTKGIKKIQSIIVQKCNSKYTQNLVKIAGNILNVLSNEQFKTAYHEIGHALRLKAYGSKYSLNTKEYDNAYVEQGGDNFFKYFFKKGLGITGQGSCAADHNFSTNHGYAIVKLNNWLTAKKSSQTQTTTSQTQTSQTQTTTSQTQTPQPPTPSLEEQQKQHKELLVFAAGGINNQTYFAERLTEDMYFTRRAEFSDSLLYMNNKLYGLKYVLTDKGNNVSSDPVAIEGNYHYLNVAAKRSDITLSSLISFVLSSSTYSYLKLFKKKETKAVSMVFKKFRLPDTFAYITSKGISYKVNSAYQLNKKTQILFGIEHVMHGDAATEIHFGIRKKINKNILFSCISTVGRGYCMEAECSFLLGKHFMMRCGFTSYGKNTLIGERHSLDLRKNGNSNQLNVACAYCY